MKAHIEAKRGVLDSVFLRAILGRAGTVELPMQGGSMSPLLPSGSRVRVRELCPEESLQGAIAVIDCGPRVVVHRILSDRGTLLQSQGLRSRRADEPCHRDSIIGVVSGRVGWPLSERSLRRLVTLVNRLLQSLRKIR